MICRLEFLSEEFSENVSASTSAMTFLVVASVCFLFDGCWFVVSGNFPQDCVGFGKGAQFVEIVLPTFLLGFLNEI